MTLIKKIDVEKHLAGRRAARRAAALFASQPHATGFSGIEPAAATPAVQDFARDFTKEHSSRVPAASVPLAANSGGNRANPVPGSRPM